MSKVTPTDVSFLGCDFIVDPRDNNTERFLWQNLKSPEYRATKHLSDLMQDSDGTIVDVGANAGIVFIPILKAAGKNARAIVFEPNPVMLRRLHKNIERNQLTEVDVFECAISDEPGQLPMVFPNRKNLGEGRLRIDQTETSSDTIVEVRTLLACLTEANVKSIDLLKIDVEGLEDRVLYPFLRDAVDILPKYIYFEVAHQEHWKYPVLELLEEKGYSFVSDFGPNKLFQLA